MIIPLLSSQLNFLQRIPKNIIIHHTYEMNINYSDVILDNPKFQLPTLRKWNYNINKEYSLPYHFVLEQVRMDYEAFIERPLITECYFEDLDEYYNKNSIHIALFGNFNEDIPSNRLYQCLSYKLIVPLVRAFRIQEENIFLHRDLVKETKNVCPGIFVKKNKILSLTRKYMKKKTVNIK